MTIPMESKVELHLAPNGAGCKLLVDDVDISSRTYKVEIVAEVGEPTKVIFYTHLPDVTALGDTWVQYIATPRFAPPEKAEA